MEKKKKLIICWAVILVLCLMSAVGIFIGEKALLNKVINVMSAEMSETVKYVPKILSITGYSEIPEDWDDVQKAGAILVTTYSSDICYEDPSDYLEDANAAYLSSMYFVYKITDPNGNELCSGTKAAVQSEKCSNKMTECLHSANGYICVDKYFENDLGAQIDEFIKNDEDVSIRIDSYVMNNYECIPLSITVLDANDAVLSTVDCSANCPADLQGNKVVDSPLYVHSPSEVCWGPNDSLIEAREYLDNWIANNSNLTGEGTESKSTLKEGNTVYYSKDADCSYYVLTNPKYEKKTLILSYVTLVGIAIGVLCIIGAVVTVITCVSSKKRR